MLGAIVILVVLYVLRTALLPFISGLVLAYLLRPIISWLEKRLPLPDKWRQTKRVVLILLIFIVIAGLVGLLSFYIVTAVINAFLVLVNNAPQYISKGLLALQGWVGIFREQLPSGMQQQVDELILDIGTMAGNAVRSGFTRGVSSLPNTFSLLLGFGALPLFLFFILKDSEKLSNSLYSSLPPRVAEHTRNIIAIIERVLGQYIRAQLTLGFIVAYFCFIGLFILKIPFAAALAAFAGVTEIIPTLGPWIGGIAAVIVTLAVAPEKVIWVAFIFLVVQMFENNLLVPRIQGSYLHIHPAILIMLLVVGAYIAGFWGILLAAPLTATLIEIYRYIRARTKSGESQ